MRRGEEWLRGFDGVLKEGDVIPEMLVKGGAGSAQASFADVKDCKRIR